MMFLVIFFISPLYFLIRKKWWGFILNSIIYGIAVVFLVTVIFFWVGIFFWMLGVGHAGWVLRYELMEKQAELIAEKFADKKEENNT